MLVIGSDCWFVHAGVIVESEDLHREAYNASFAHHNICCSGDETVATWSESFYDDLSNKVGGGKPKMRWYFGKQPHATSASCDIIVWLALLASL